MESNITQSAQKPHNKDRVRTFYENKLATIRLKTRLVELRKAANLTQEEVAIRMNTSKPQISRLESINSTISPTISTLLSYARAVGCEVDIEFTPMS